MKGKERYEDPKFITFVICEFIKPIGRERVGSP
jgi:hypothetical protein